MIGYLPSLTHIQLNGNPLKFSSENICCLRLLTTTRILLSLEQIPQSIVDQLPPERRLADESVEFGSGLP
jgi:hypothetical protein